MAFPYLESKIELHLAAHLLYDTHLIFFISLSFNFLPQLMKKVLLALLQRDIMTVEEISI